VTATTQMLELPGQRSSWESDPGPVDCKSITLKRCRAARGQSTLRCSWW